MSMLEKAGEMGIVEKTQTAASDAFERASDRVNAHENKIKSELQKELAGLIEGTLKANYDHKRWVCNRMNEFLRKDALLDGREPIMLYRTKRDGKIEMYYPAYEPEVELPTGQFGKFGSLGFK